MSDAEQSAAPPTAVGFRKVGKRRIETRRREEAAAPTVEKPADEAGRAGLRSRNVTPMLAPTPTTTSENPEEGEKSAVVRKTERTSVVKNKRMKKNPMLVTSNRNRAIRDRKTADSSSSSSGESESTDGEEAERAKALDIDCKYASANDAQAAGPRDMGATARNEIDTEFDKDYQSQFERVQNSLKEAEAGAIYRGMKMYGAKEAKDSTKGKASSGLNHYGPIRAQQFMRRFDSCKFLHDRSDYKHGWEIERDWQKQQEEKKKGVEEDYTIYSDED
ncbi:hypothetical protein M3Y99_01702000 [Aphelenchoides fujianensis]|nr:hypothetical protein M3Y99_01702000 [Aphelenchoides fujianensis]